MPSNPFRTGVCTIPVAGNHKFPGFGSGPYSSWYCKNCGCMAAPNTCTFPETMFPGIGDKITILIGVGVLVGKKAKVGGNDIEVGGSCPLWVVGTTSAVTGKVVGSIPVGCPVPVPTGVLVGTSVN